MNKSNGVETPMNTLEDKYTIGYEYETHPPYYRKDIEKELSKQNLTDYYSAFNRLYIEKTQEFNVKSVKTLKANTNLMKTSYYPEGCGDVTGIEYVNGVFDSLQFSKEYADHLLNHIVTVGTAYHPGAGIHVHISKFKNKLKQQAIFSFFMNPNYYPYFHKISDRRSYTTWMKNNSGTDIFKKVDNENDIVQYTGKLPIYKGFILTYRSSFHTYEFRLFAAKPENLHPAIDMLVSVRNIIDVKNNFISWNNWIDYLKLKKETYPDIINKLNEHDLFKPFSELKPYTIPTYPQNED